MSIKINKIQLSSIFSSEFNNLQNNNIIEFPVSGVAILYGPNGTGKTSFANALKKGSGAEISLEINGEIINSSAESPFHIIEDQNGRNIIKGETEDFILGDDIRHEYDLKNSIDHDFKKIFQDLNSILRNQYKITKKSSPLLKLISIEEINSFISDIINNQSKGVKIDKNEFIEEIQKHELFEINEFDQTKLDFVITDYKENNSIIKKIIAITEINSTLDLVKIEQHDDALGILRKYDNLEECIICDSAIDQEERIDAKNLNKQTIIDSLSDETKRILDEIINLLDYSNPFSLKTQLLDVIKNGDNALLNTIKDSFNEYFEIYNKSVINIILSSLNNYNVISDLTEYNTIIQQQPIFTEEEVLFIEQFINECIEKEIQLIRNEAGLMELRLGSIPLLHTDRKDLYLSNGEQNFISLAFELLKARKNEQEYIILDDPISSFDSIFKNKIAFAILKFLSNKKQIILTHSTDLIKLLEHQKQNCFNLYLLNNVENESNGFIPINRNEQEILLYIHNLINLLRNPIKDEIVDEKSFVISTIPFMRGYCQIINDTNKKNDLTKIMHGYSEETVNITQIYNELFETDIIENEYVISAKDIIEYDVDNLDILNLENYPLLNKTLKHTFTYLHLRLKVEKVLSDKYHIDTDRYDMLTQIIQRSFRGNSEESIKNRVFLLSRKTLLNEFNHYEVDMNIFQPAIDITDTSLLKEKDAINTFLTNL